MGHPLFQWETVRVVSNHSKPPPLFLADMRTEEGETLRTQAERLASKTAVELGERISLFPQYEALRAVLRSERLHLYFEKRINTEVYPALRALCVMEWCIHNGRAPEKREVVWHDHHYLGQALQDVWPSKEVRLVLGAPRTFLTKARLWARGVRDSLYQLAEGVNGRVRDGASCSVQSLDDPTIAVHYVEGIDLSRRSDIFWYPESQIDPNRILVYFDRLSPVNRRFRKDLVGQIERMSFRWVCLGNASVSLDGKQACDPNKGRRSLLKQWRQALNDIESVTPTHRWFNDAVATLLGEVGYWYSVYKALNIKIHLEMDEGGLVPVAQAIALDMVGGIHIGRQRSDSWGWGFLGHHPDHVYFAWNGRGAAHARKNRNRIESIIICGFPYDSAWRFNPPRLDVRELLAAKGVSFVVALFDNAFWWGGIFSRAMIGTFYRVFLEWVLEDPEIGVVNKSKKPTILEQLPELRNLMKKAEMTGRWLNLTNVFGRSPSDASRAADISVGVGISSAVTEAVAAGGRGIHLDLTRQRPFPFYEWAYERVVFDDVERMMAALRRYKSDRTSEPGLGDFSHKMDQIDPFHDGQAGERVGTYIRWLLEAFDRGYGRDAAIREANTRYAERWGADKVLDFSAGATKQ